MKETLQLLIAALPTTQNTLAFADVMSALGLDKAKASALTLPKQCDRFIALRKFRDSALRARAVLDNLGWSSNEHDENLTRKQTSPSAVNAPMWADLVGEVLASHPDWNGTHEALGTLLEAHPSGDGTGASSHLAKPLVRKALAHHMATRAATAPPVHSELLAPIGLQVWLLDAPKTFSFETLILGMRKLGENAVNDHATRKELTSVLTALGFVKFRSGAGMRWRKATS